MTDVINRRLLSDLPAVRWSDGGVWRTGKLLLTWAPSHSTPLRYAVLDEDRGEMVLVRDFEIDEPKDEKGNPR